MDTIIRNAAGLPDSIQIWTRKGTPITNTVEVCGAKELHAHRHSVLLSGLVRQELEVLKDLAHGDGSYNCVGLVFAARRVYISPDQVDLIINEDGYGPIEPTVVREGDLVVWRHKPNGEAQHVGQVAYVDKIGGVLCPYVISKWGAEGEFLHPPQLVPSVFGIVIEYYRIQRDV